MTFPSTKTNILNPPWDTSKKPVEVYSPVDCDFTDELEYVAVKKIIIELKHWNKDFSVSEVAGLIKDIKTSNQEEHLILSNGDQIRLDYIIQVKIKGF